MATKIKPGVVIAAASAAGLLWWMLRPRPPIDDGNLCPNPSFERNLDGWTSVNDEGSPESELTRVAGGTDGSWACKITAIGTKLLARAPFRAPPVLAEGDSYRFSVSILGLGATINKLCYIEIRGLKGEWAAQYEYAAFPIPSSWTEFSGSMTLQRSDLDAMTFGLHYGGFVAGDAVLIDRVRIEHVGNILG